MEEDVERLLGLERRGLQIGARFGRLEIRGETYRLTGVDRDWLQARRDTLVQMLTLPEIVPLNIDPTCRRRTSSGSPAARPSGRGDQQWAAGGNCSSKTGCFRGVLRRILFSKVSIRLIEINHGI